MIKKKFGENDYTGMTYTDIQYDYKIIKDSVYINIKAVFNTRLSWLNASDTTLSGLKHEQGHFDICEIMARQMRRDFYEGFSIKSSNYYYKNLKNLRRKYVTKLNKLNKLYDKETNHGINKSKQLEWESTIIPKMLIQNEGYENAMILITKS
ncbi:MAG: DUF922 domain-containing protein [Bacteroidia bacterium]|nr:DUF922 domain-containing protein [Bacteroidia bacterium]